NFKTSSITIQRYLMLVALVALSITVYAAGNSEGEAAEYPTKPITLMVGFSAGGSTDMYARAFSSFAHEQIGMPLVVVNQPGASGMIAAKSVYDARPDGYTLLLASGGGFFIKAASDGDRALVVPMQDLKVLGSIGQSITALVVPADSPFKTARELVEYAKAHPEERLRWSHPGRSSTKGMSGSLFLEENGIVAQDVPFAGGSKARNAVSAKQVDFSFIGVQLLGGFENKLRALGVMSDERDLIFNDIPTLKEQGLPALGISNPMIIWGHKDLPEDVVAKLKETIKNVASSDVYNEMAKKMGIPGNYSSPEDAITQIAVIDKLMTPFITKSE
ncbi:MAG: tripartite tricarboxylate transporter substrate binding protein, partial [Desulfuromonadales bacterium]|nr:tripartite tricarboxylate transporter substrate binding protein [Desulfuromonadales bacterium]